MRRWWALVVLAGCDCEGGDLGLLHALLDPPVTELDFGQVYLGASAERDLSLRGSGDAPVLITGLSSTGAEFGAELEPKSLIGAGETRAIAIRYTPSALGPQTATFTVLNDSENRPSIEVHLTGVGLEPLNCDDGKVCTDDFFDSSLGLCLSVEREGDCDDGNACTDGDRCVRGECLGVGLECDEGSECTTTLCDPSRGCVYVPHAERCIDGDPCTEDLCDIDDGCDNPGLPEGSICGPVVECITANICILGACREVDIPEGFRCNDHDLCTDNDHCFEDRCTGFGFLREPEVLGTALGFGFGDNSSPWMAIELTLEDGQMIFADRDLTPRGETHLDVASAPLGSLELRARTTVPGWLERLTAIDDVSFLGISWPASRTATTGPSLELYTLEPQGSVRPRGRLGISGSTPRIAVGDGYAYLCEPGQLVVIDLADLDAPVRTASVATGPQGCNDLAFDRTRSRLLIANNGLDVWDLTDPALPLAGPSYFQGATNLEIEVDGDLGAITSWEGLPGVALIDLDTMTLSSTVPADGTVFGLADGVLVAQSFPEVHFWDVRDPVAPVQVATTPAGPGAPINLVVEHGRAVYYVDVESSARVYAYDLAATPPVRRLQGPGLGAAGIYVSPGHLASRDSARTINLSNPMQPRFVEGGSYDPPAEASAVPYFRTFGSFYTFDRTDLDIGREAVNLVDVFDPLAPVQLGAWSFGAWGRPRSDPSGRWLYRQEARAIYVFDALSALPNTSPMPIAEIAIGAAGVMVLAIDPRSERALVVEPLELERSRLTFIDVTDPVNPMTLASLDVDGLFFSAAIFGESIALLGTDAPYDQLFLNGGQPYPGDRVVRFDWSAPGTLSETMTATISDARVVLAYDGESAMIGTEAGVTVLDLLNQPAHYRFALPLPEVPLSMTLVGEQLLLLSATSASVMSVPCLR